MLEQKDFKQIKKIFSENGKQLEKRLDQKFSENGKQLEKRLDQKFSEHGRQLEKRLVAKIGEVIEDNLMPVLDDHGKRLDRLEKKINNLPDKLYLSDKLADLQANTTARQRKEDEKVNLLIDFLKKRKVLKNNEVDLLEEIEVFPKLQKSLT